MGDLAYGDYSGDYFFTQPNQAYPAAPQYTSYSTQPVPTSMSAQGFPASATCEHCGQVCNLAYAQKQNGRPYYACKQSSYGGTCVNEKGWFCWADELGKPKKQFGQKRPAPGPAPAQPPAQRPAQAPVQRQEHVTPEMLGRAPAPPQGQTDAYFLRLQQQIGLLTQKVDFLTAFITQHLSGGTTEEEGTLQGAVDAD